MCLCHRKHTHKPIREGDEQMNNEYIADTISSRQQYTFEKLIRYNNRWCFMDFIVRQKKSWLKKYIRIVDECYVEHVLQYVQYWVEL